MTGSELTVLSRAHQLFGARPWLVPLDGGLEHRVDVLERIAQLHVGGGRERYRLAVLAQRDAVLAAARTDATATGILAAAHTDYLRARQHTGNVVDAARAEAATPDTPLAQREAMRRRAARLRSQRTHVLSARQRALAHRAALRRLHYGGGRRRDSRPDRLRLPPPNSRVGRVLRAALSRLGRPYVWGATGPDQFDCSGLTQWAYAQAGVRLDRTTYQQIHDGIPVSPAHIRPGDLVFPTVGHVQLALGDNLVIEAPHPGAVVRISRLGAQVAIRRPLF